MENNDYHISFFKPTTDSARRNRNMILQLVLVWALAIFGFQIMLKILEKPTPEPAYLLYESGWAAITSGQAEAADLQATAQAALSVLGKVAIEAEEREVLDRVVSWTAWELCENKAQLKASISEFEEKAAVTTDITDKDYVAIKEELIPVLAGLFGLSEADVRSKISPLEVKSAFMGSFEDGRDKLPAIMNKYLIHNQSFLTDAKFLGFPFHYFYTAVFLLILFVGICWIYCVRTDLFNKKYGIED